VRRGVDHRSPQHRPGGREVDLGLGATLPCVAELALAATHDGVLGRCDDNVEFEFALDLILDGLDRLQRD
jgi:hypothetical protein